MLADIIWVHPYVTLHKAMPSIPQFRILLYGLHVLSIENFSMPRRAASTNNLTSLVDISAGPVLHCLGCFFSNRKGTGLNSTIFLSVFFFVDMLTLRINLSYDCLHSYTHPVSRVLIAPVPWRQTASGWAPGQWSYSPQSDTEHITIKGKPLGHTERIQSFRNLSDNSWNVDCNIQPL